MNLSAMRDPRRAAAIILPRRHIFLLSHMRAYTTLFGHIMGSNPAICGYYELHIGYHSWKSLVRQKLVYFEQEQPKRGFRYMFDKILHNDHNASPDVLGSRRCRTLFCLRQPGETIPSILKLYREVDPGHAFNSEEFATRYYIERLDTLQRLSDRLAGKFFYFDADTLRQPESGLLADLGQWLQLATPLTPHYDIQRRTAEPRYGDSSADIMSGVVRPGPRNHGGHKPDPGLLKAATEAYYNAREALIRNSARRCLSRQADCLPGDSNDATGLHDKLNP